MNKTQCPHPRSAHPLPEGEGFSDIKISWETPPSSGSGGQGAALSLSKRMRAALILMISLITITCSAAARAESGDTITVTAGSVTEVEELKRQPGFIDIIDTAKAMTSMSSVTEILAERAGITVKRYGGIGGHSTVSIRGSNPNQVMIFIDGVPLNDTVTGEVNIGDIPLDNIERIEVYKGFAPVGLSSSGIGGAINLVTKKNRTASHHQGALGYGSCNTTKVSLVSSKNFDVISYTLFFNRTSSDGDFEFLDDNGTPVINTGDDRTIKRKNNGHESYTTTGKIDCLFEPFTVTVSDNFFHKDQGLPGMYNNTAVRSRLTSMSNTARISAAPRKTLADRFNGRMDIFHSIRIDAYEDPDGEIGLKAEKEKGLYNSFGMDLTLQALVTELNPSITVLGSVIRDTYTKSEKDDRDGEKLTSGPEQERISISFALEDELSFLGDRLRFVPQIRINMYMDRFTPDDRYFSETGFAAATSWSETITWKAGARYYVLKEKKMSLYAQGSAGSNIRMPVFTELFGDRGFIIGNSSLKPERSLNSEIGISAALNHLLGIHDLLDIQYVFFYNTIDDGILYVQNSQWTLKAQNISGARIMGHEVSLGASVFNHVKISMNYTNQLAKDKSAIPYYRGKILPGHPVHDVSFRATVFSRRVSLSYEMNFTGAVFRDRMNSEFYYVPEKYIHGITAEIMALDGLVMAFEIKNLTDSMVRDNIGYPLPGRSYYGTVSYAL